MSELSTLNKMTDLETLRTKNIVDDLLKDQIKKRKQYLSPDDLASLKKLTPQLRNIINSLSDLKEAFEIYAYNQKAIVVILNAVKDKLPEFLKNRSLQFFLIDVLGADTHGSYVCKNRLIDQRVHYYFHLSHLDFVSQAPNGDNLKILNCIKNLLPEMLKDLQNINALKQFIVEGIYFSPSEDKRYKLNEYNKNFFDHSLLKTLSNFFGNDTENFFGVLQKIVTCYIKELTDDKREHSSISIGNMFLRVPSQHYVFRSLQLETLKTISEAIESNKFESILSNEIVQKNTQKLKNTFTGDVIRYITHQLKHSDEMDCEEKTDHACERLRDPTCPYPGW